MYSKIFLTLCACAVLSTACKKDDEPTPAPTPEGKEYTGDFLLETTVKNPDGMSGSSYVQVFQKLSGTITNDNAEQLEFASCVQVTGKDVYIFDLMKGTNVTHWVYDPAAKKLNKGASLPTPVGSFVGHLEKVSDTKAYMPLYTQGVVWIINPQTMKKTGEIALQEYAHGDNSADPAMGFVRDGKYYLSLNQIDPNASAPYADYLQSDVAIIDVQTDKVEKIASEKTSGLIYPTRSMAPHSGMMFTNEAGDLYIATSGYFGFNPANTKCGFLCIPKGATEFDTNRSWDISTTPIEGYEHKAATVINTQYIGNNKVAAYVGIRELNGQNPYIAKNVMAVIIDLSAKTIKKIDGIPFSDGHSIAIGKLENKAVFAAFGTDKAGLFTFDPTTSAVQQVLSTVGNPAYFHAFK